MFFIVICLFLFFFLEKLLFVPLLQFFVQIESGSAQDASIGNDRVPQNSLEYVEIGFECANVDECDVCFGDSLACRDCAFIPNGPNVYDACDVCGGDGQSCANAGDNSTQTTREQTLPNRREFAEASKAVSNWSNLHTRLFLYCLSQFYFFRAQQQK